MTSQTSVLRRRKIIQTVILPVGLALLLFISLTPTIYRRLIHFESAVILNPQYINEINVTDNPSHNNTVVIDKQNWKLIYWQKPRKTAGTSLRNLFINNGIYEQIDGQYCWDEHNPESFKIVKERCISTGHKLFWNEFCPFHLSEYLKYKHEQWNDVLLLTSLRDPIKRVFSDMLWWGTWSCKDINYSTTSDPNIETKLINCLYANHAKFTQNIYTKIFSGVWPYMDPNDKLMRKNVDFNPNITVDDVQFEIAKSILKEFNVIIILEIFEYTSLQLKCYGINNNTLPHKRVSKLSLQYELDNFPTLKQYIIEMNGFDIKLYEFAKQLAVRKTSECVAYLNHFTANDI